MNSNFNNLISFISKFVELTEIEKDIALSKVEVLNLKRNKILIDEGQVADIIAFTNKGYLRVYFNHDGDEITRDITPINTFATALPSFINQTPSYEIIRAITDCELFIIKRKDLEYLYDNFPKWERVGRRIMEDMFVDAQQRLYQFITQTAEVRYRMLLHHYPDMIQNVPLKYIADFLGIKLQSLSRLRKTIEW